MRYLISIVLLLLGVFCVWRGFPSSEPALEAPGARARRVSLEAPRAVEQRIETIVVGQRVRVGENPSSERDYRFGSDVIDPSGWRKMTLRCPKRDGSVAEVEMLRPTAWLAEREVRVGGRVDLEVPECGIEGLAEVLAVDRCPPIAPGPGRVVTATFHHHSAQTLNVWVEALIVVA